MGTSRRSESPLPLPVRSRHGTLALRLFRTPAGKRTAVAFSSREQLMEVLGEGHAWTRLSERVLREMVEGLDVAGIVIDPAGTLESRNRHLGTA
jgi:hypothetical protein